MTEEAQINTETVETTDSVREAQQDVETVREAQNFVMVNNSPNTKAAEKKLKEMSRKAKERGKPQNAQRARSDTVIKLNQNWLLGGLGISAIIMIGYFIFKSRGDISEPPPELQPFHHAPPKEKEEQEKPNSFDLNSF